MVKRADPVGEILLERGDSWPGQICMVKIMLQLFCGMLKLQNCPASGMKFCHINTSRIYFGIFAVYLSFQSQWS